MIFAPIILLLAPLISLSTHVDELLDVSGGEVPEDGGVVEVGQPGHVLAHVKLGWIDL